MLGLDLLAAIATVQMFNFVSKYVSLFTTEKKEKKKRVGGTGRVKKEIMPFRMKGKKITLGFVSLGLKM